MERAIDTSQIGNILIDSDSISDSISKLAGQIEEAFAQSKAVTVIILLDGAKRFADDLFEFINNKKFRLEYVEVKSYKGTESSGDVKVNGAMPNLYGTDILIIDDIYDSGRTMHHMLEIADSHNANSIKTCVLLKKQVTRDYPDLIDFYGFDIPDTFIVGYGLDHDGQYRDLPYIAQLDA